MEKGNGLQFYFAGGRKSTNTSVLKGDMMESLEIIILAPMHRTKSGFQIIAFTVKLSYACVN